MIVLLGTEMIVLLGTDLIVLPVVEMVGSLVAPLALVAPLVLVGRKWASTNEDPDEHELSRLFGHFDS
jgi:hypothetical protein